MFRNDSISDLTVEIKAVFLEKCLRAGANIKISDKLSWQRQKIQDGQADLWSSMNQGSES